jgi:ABC-2 type transport system permease protein
LLAVNVLHPTLGLALGLGLAMVVVDRLGWRVVSALFDRERLITGAR